MRPRERWRMPVAVASLPSQGSVVHRAAERSGAPAGISLPGCGIAHGVIALPCCSAAESGHAGGWTLRFSGYNRRSKNCFTVKQLMGKTHLMVLLPRVPSPTY